jgi:pyrroline-5-carboxylate reductase
MSASPAILLLGFGNMGQALANGWLSPAYAARTITVVDPHPAAQAAARAAGLRVSTGESAGGADVVVVAVKPAQIAEALRAIPSGLASRAVFLSIVAGKTMTELAKSLGNDAAIVRAMPNTPAAIGQGVTALFARANVSEVQRRISADLMAAVGRVEWIEDEALMDVVTALSGSGPAYVFLLIECLTEAGRELGLSPDLAARLATETVAGAGAYARQAGQPAAELRRRVTSPNGTTQAALEVLQSEHGLEQLIRRAVSAAAKRSRELSGE